MLKRLVNVLIIFIAALAVFYWSVAHHYRSSNEDKPVEYGVSFSQPYAESLGLDWQKTYTALVGDLGFKKLRLMSYWNEVEPAKGQYDFEDLDWQLAQANNHGVEVVLVVGARQPRWPECHVPSWAQDFDDAQFNQALYDYIETVVKRYENNQVIKQWQLENEPRNVVFSTCRPYYDQQRLQTEFNTIKSNDSSNRPIYTNLSNEFQLPLSQPIGDKVGYSIYEEVNAEVLGKRVQWQHVIPSSWHSFRSGLIDVFSDRPTYIHELQAEPWGHQATVNMTQDEQKRTMNPEMLVDNLDYAQKTGTKLIYLWGGEWWYQQKEVHSSPQMWEQVRQSML